MSMAGITSLFLYVSVLLVSVASVLLGLDWLAAPPPPPGKAPVQVARAPMPVIKPPMPTRNSAQDDANAGGTEISANAAAKPSTGAAGGQAPGTTGVSRSEAATAEAAASVKSDPVGAVMPDAAETSAAVPDGALNQPGDTPAATAEPAPLCDLRACEAAYGSFRASDCTWQPYNGPRRFCDKGTPPRASVPATTAQAQASTCNIPACSRAYNSFDATDCTWQPYEGPRQLCEK